MLSKLKLKRETSRSTMYVVKRDGRVEPVDPAKIVNRINQHMNGLDKNHIDPTAIMQKVVLGLFNRVTTVELDSLTAENCASLTTVHNDHAILAARIAVSNLHKETKSKFSDVVYDLYHYINPKNNTLSPMVSEALYNLVQEHKEKIDAAIDYSRDFEYNYFGFKTLEKSYLLKYNGKTYERPQHLLMRVSLGIHLDNVDEGLMTYKYMSEKLFTHASPTLFNSGTPHPQMSSCFLLTMQDDSIDGIYETLKQCALISKYAGGIGLSVHTIRGQGSYISGTNGESNGIIPMIRVFNNTARYVDQGGNKRPGAFAIYLEPWHPDIFSFVELRKNTGAEEVRARDLFYALWIPDLFMDRVEKDEDWTLMDPNECPGLPDCWGPEFNALYLKYEEAEKGVRTVKARELWYAIVDAQIETGNPYILYKDACNSKSNQQHLGTIRSSNLCTEIVEYSSPDEIAVCNLASISLPAFVKEDEKSFDFEKLRLIVKVITRNLNKVIDINFYPLPQAKLSNMRHRPIGIGIQGLADTFMMLKYPYDSVEAGNLNKLIFENIYFAALEASCELAEKSGTYETYPGCPISKGILQPDMWNLNTDELSKISGLDWKGLKKKIEKHGIRNSLLVAPMPTASTAQILGNTESFEPLTSNIYSRRVLSGEFQIVNNHLQRELIKLGIWSDDLKNAIIANQGSIRHIEGISDEIKDVYKTVWEISQKDIIRMAAERAPFIDQSQSLNLYLAQPNYGKITSMHFYSWKAGLKTGMYYLRTRPAAEPIKFTIDKTRLATGVLEGKENQAPNISQLKLTDEKDKKKLEESLKMMACSLANPEGCTMCSG